MTVTLNLTNAAEPRLRAAELLEIIANDLRDQGAYVPTLDVGESDTYGPKPTVTDAVPVWIASWEVA